MFLIGAQQKWSMPLGFNLFQIKNENAKFLGFIGAQNDSIGTQNGSKGLTGAHSKKIVPRLVFKKRVSDPSIFP